MKKIGMITFHSAHNYGAMLQVYALQKTLLNNGYQAEIIDYRDKKIMSGYKLFKLNKKNLYTIIKSFASSLFFLIPNYMRAKRFNNFLKKYLKTTKIKYKSEKELKDNPPDEDIYIVGSDQVWNTALTGSLKDAYTLNFGKDNVKRISYAASIGKSEIPDTLKDIFKEKISKIDKISVREEQAKELLSGLINKNIDVVLDPTLLLEKEKWMSLIEKKEKEKEKYIFIYGIGERDRLYKIANYFSEKTNLKLVHFDNKNKGYKNVLKSAYSDGPIEFLNLIKNAEYVIAQSFHGTVFSLIFRKKFFVIPDKTTSSRVINLLKKLGLEDRIINSIEEIGDYDREINYEEVESKLKFEREKSLEFLKNSIDGE